MLKRTLLLSVLCIFLAFNSASQNAEIDSLKNVLIGMPQDSNRLAILMTMSGKLYRVNPDTGIVYSQKAIDLASALDRKEDLGYALKNIGLSYYFKTEFDEVLKYWNESLDAFRSIEDATGISNLLNNLGAVYYSRGDDPRALEYYLESIKYAQEIGNKARMATAYTNIGAIYAKEEATYDLARDNYLKCIEISKELGRLDQLGTAAVNIGQLYRKEDNLDKALEYFEIGLEAFQEVGGNVATALNFMGGIYSERGDYAKAMQLHTDAYKYALERDAKMELAQSYQGIGRVNLDQNNYSAAIRSFQNSLDIAETAGLNNSRRNAFEGLAVAYGELGNYRQAYNYQTRFTDLVDSLRTKEAEDKLSDLKFQFDYESKQQEIALLNIDNDLKTAQIERDANLQKFLMAVGALLFIILGGILFQYRYAKRANALLETERNKAEEILLNILPKETADELKDKGKVNAREYKKTTVLFTDFKGFTGVSENIPPEDLVKSIDFYFRKFDEIIGKYNLEKIKTIGDSYMCAGGLPSKNDSNPLDAVRASIEIMEFVNNTRKNPPEGIYQFEVRIGMNTGPLVAGVVGTKKFQYDIWGNTVNIASRMESSSEPGKINISDTTYQSIKEYFECKYRGEIDIKNAGKQKMYFVEGLKEENS